MTFATNKLSILIILPRFSNSDEVTYSYMYPLGLGYISAVLKSHECQVDVLNLNHFAGSIKSLVTNWLLSHSKYDYIMSGGLSYHYQFFKQISDGIKASPFKGKFVMGGGIVSSEPKLVCKEFGIDIGVMREGEETIVDIINGQKKLSDIQGICYFDSTDNKTKITEYRSPISNLDSLPWPDFDGFQFNEYLNNMRPSDYYFYSIINDPRVYPIVCSRSCPFLCTFCYHPIGNEYRQRSIDSIFQELESNVPKYDINILAIYDELFSHDRNRVFQICDRINILSDRIKRPLRWSCQMRVNKIDEELLKIMKETGCYMISYGFESYSSDILQSMKKHIAPEQIDYAINLTQKAGICIQGNFLFGDTKETTQTAKETLKYWKKRREIGLPLTFIEAYPGTEIYKQAIDRGIIKDKVKFMENHEFGKYNLTENMTSKEFNQLQSEVYISDIKYRCNSMASKIKSHENGTYSFSVKCPFCNNLNTFANFIFSSPFYFERMLYCRKCNNRFYVVSKIAGLSNSISKIIMTIASISNITKKIVFKTYPLIGSITLRILKRINQLVRNKS